MATRGRSQRYTLLTFRRARRTFHLLPKWYLKLPWLFSARIRQIQGHRQPWDICLFCEHFELYWSLKGGFVMRFPHVCLCLFDSKICVGVLASLDPAEEENGNRFGFPHFQELEFQPAVSKSQRGAPALYSCSSGACVRRCNCYILHTKILILLAN